jgi:hypothetical protein
MRYNHLDMLPEKAFQPVGKRMTLEGGGGKDGGGGSVEVPPFKPWAVATPVGGTTIGKNKVTANLSPELQNFYNMYLAGAQTAMPTAQAQTFGTDVSNLGEQIAREAAAMSVPDLTSNYLAKQQALLAPGRAAEETRLADTLFKQGRTGAAVGMEGGYVNPEQFALLQAREQQNAQLALQAEDRARQIQNAQAQQGITLFGLGEQLKTVPYGTSAQILGYGTNLASLLNPNIAYGMQAGQAAQQSAIAQAQMQAQQQSNSKGLLGGLASAGAQLGSAYMTGGRSLFPSIGGFGGGGQAGGTGINLGGSYTPSWY